MKKLILSIGMFVAGPSFGQQCKTFFLWDDTLPIAQRVNDGLSRLRLEEKVGQMLNAVPTITRPGIPAYGWWNETLHDVASTHYHITSYPQAIAMATTWDTVSLHLMAGYSATKQG
ncbi:hypothetical protein [Chitinophaga sancti]|uniref:hypothetical protein n=1 Tax=Chitinophaga sancti TaxID=1004 RepID=UPI003F7AF7C4